jgi:voltage-dependent calcium channel alpha-2/delta-3
LSSFCFKFFITPSPPVSYTDDYGTADPTERYDMPATKSKEQEFDKRVLINRTRPERCDKIITLYKLYRERNKDEKAPPQEMTDDRPFIVVSIPSSNMILIVASTLASKENLPFVNIPVEKHYNASSLQCHKLKNFPTHRRHLPHCFNKHQNESQIEICGKASKFYISFYMLSLATLVTIRNFVTN